MVKAADGHSAVAMVIPTAILVTPPPARVSIPYRHHIPTCLQRKLSQTLQASLFDRTNKISH